MHNSNNEQFLNDVVLPYFNGYLKSNIDFVLYSPDSTILAMSPSFPSITNLKNEELIGCSLRTLTPEFVMRGCNIEFIEANELIHEFEKVAKINDIVCIEKITVSFIDVIPYKNSLNAFLVTQIPIFDPEGEVVAIQSLATTFYLFGLDSYLTSIQSSISLLPIKTQKSSIKLSKRQHEVLFLLLSGMTQTNISQFLGIKRGTTSSAVNRLCEKFNISGANTGLLLKAAKRLHFHEYIPDGLRKPRIIILDPLIKDKYFTKI